MAYLKAVEGRYDLQNAELGGSTPDSLPREEESQQPSDVKRNAESAATTPHGPTPSLSLGHKKKQAKPDHFHHSVQIKVEDVSKAEQAPDVNAKSKGAGIPDKKQTPPPPQRPSLQVKNNPYRKKTPSPSKKPSSSDLGRQSVLVAKDRGYSITRSPSNVAVNIDTSTFFDGVTETKKERPRSGSKSHPTSSTAQRKIQELNQQLEQMNISNLELQAELAQRELDTEKEKDAHEAEKKAIHETYVAEKDVIRSKHHHEMRECTLRHEDEVSSLKISHDNEILHLRLEYENKEAELKEQLEELKASHAQTIEETRMQNMKIIENAKKRLHKEHKHELEQMEKMMKQDSTEQMRQLREELMLEHERKIEEIVKEHKEELGAMEMYHTKIEELEEQLAKLKKHAKKVEKQCSRLKAELKEANAEQRNAEAKLLETNIELKEFKDQYHIRIVEAQAKTKDRLDELTFENCQLRKKLLLKSEEFSNYRTQIEVASAKTIKNYKEKVEVMVKARTRANLSIAMGLTEIEDELITFNRMRRPSSAPTTQVESQGARRLILSQDLSEEKQRQEATESASGLRGDKRRHQSAQDYGEGRRKQEKSFSPRPNSCLPKFQTVHSSS